MTLTTPTHPTALAERLAVHATRRGHSPKPIVLSAVATHCLLLGAESKKRAAMVAALGELAMIDPERFKGKYTALWETQTAEYPYLRGYLDPFTGWLAYDREGVRALGAALAETSTMDLHAAAEAPGVGGDLLGQVLTALEAPGDQKARGAFYTPASIAGLIAQIATPDDWSTFNDSCCGGGALAVAAIRAMRRIGRHPATVTWVLNDLDPTAVAVAGVAMAIHGMPHVVLTVGDALAPQCPEHTEIPAPAATAATTASASSGGSCPSL